MFGRNKTSTRHWSKQVFSRETVKCTDNIIRFIWIRRGFSKMLSQQLHIAVATEMSLINDMENLYDDPKEYLVFREQQLKLLAEKMENRGWILDWVFKITMSQETAKWNPPDDFCPPPPKLKC